MGRVQPKGITMSKITDMLLNAKSDATAFNASHGKATAVIVAVVVTFCVCLYFFA
jgi:hypothetical protein